MKLAIMQPYFLPYIGYWQLMKSVDTFVLYDDIQFSKKGWIHRNRVLLENTDKMLSLPLKKDSDFLDINQRKLADNSKDSFLKYNRIIEQNYKKAPYFKDVFPLVSSIFLEEEENLFDFIYSSINKIKHFLEIETEVIISSNLKLDHKLFRGKDKVIEIAKFLKADIYINAIGGVDLYDKIEFKENSISLQFIKSNPFTYKQFKNEFIPWLSIIDVLMFTPKNLVQIELNNYTLI